MRSSVGPGAGVVLPGPGPGGWQWPWWLHRQLDPGSPAWLAGDLVGSNRTGRSWTVIGVPDGTQRWLVDRRGLLAPVSGRWALDWWVGADDRWRLPASEPSTRQRLVEDAPVVETVMSVPGGEVLARHWAVPGDDGDRVVVEVANESAGPVAVALALRPVGPVGPTGAHRVVLVDGRLEVDGAVSVRAGEPPRHAVVSTGGGGDVATTVMGNATSPYRDSTAECPLGWVGAALVWPLPRRSTLTAEIVTIARPGGPPLFARPAPSAAETARAWTARVTRSTRLELPAGPLAAALRAQQRHLLLADVGPHARSLDRPVAALVSAASSTAGLRSEAASGLGGWLDDQHRSGRLGGDAVDTGATVWALGVWARTGPDDGDLLRRSPLAVARAVESLARPAAGRDAVSAVWVLAGLRAGARLLALVGEDPAAARAAVWADEHLAGLLQAQSAAGSVEPASDEGLVLAAVLGVVPVAHAAVVGARERLGRSAPGVPVGAVAGPYPMLGLRPDLALLVATGAALAGEDSTAPLRWVLDAASPTWTWPTVVHPRLGTGSHGSGHDPSVTALMWQCGRAHLVADAPADSGAGVLDRLEMLPRLPGEWLGAGFEVHGLPTAAGPLSYAVRWHGDRPALLWDLAGGGPSPVMTAPGLDPAWRGVGRRGEALLAPVAVPVGDVTTPGGTAARGPVEPGSLS